jgi:hypothetical protein
MVIRKSYLGEGEGNSPPYCPTLVVLEGDGIVLPIITPNAAFGGLYRKLTAR